MSKNMSADPELLHQRRNPAGRGKHSDSKTRPGLFPWLLLALCGYVLWLYVVVQGFIPLQIAH